MEFVDNTGHIFSLSSYKEKPIGYEYEENQYIFWIDSNTSRLSINNYYARPIYILYELQNDYDIKDLEDDENSPIKISIEIENSNVYSFISPKEFHNYIISEQYNNLNDYVQLNKIEDNTEISSFKKSKLTNDDLLVYKTVESFEKHIKDKNNNVVKTFTTELNYLLIPIYPIACVKEPGTWISNILIHIYDNRVNMNEWCSISVGGEFIDEYEELIINGKNSGISLPKDILKAVYSESLYNDEFNESLYNEKLKEYLLNMVSIKHECGNFNSAINSLKWFGYGDKIEISKLLKTDNDLLDQYILDYFNISYDLIESFKKFYTDSLISLKLMINKELDEQYDFNLESDFWGENKPKMLSLIDHYEKIKVGQHTVINDEDETYYYWKPYFDFSFTELGIKLACLKGFYKKYFLPIHLYIHSSSLGYRVFMNDVKFTNTVGSSISVPSISLNAKQNEVKFNKSNSNANIYYFTKQVHYIDSQFNEFNIHNIENDKRIWYEINDTCVNIPITFISNDNNSGYFNCVLLLQNKFDEVIYESHFSFLQTNQFNYKNFIIYPKKLNISINKNSQNNEIDIKSNYFDYWINNEFIIKLLVNNKWYEHKFTLKINEPTIDFGTLNYRYYLNEHNYLLGRINKDINMHSFIFASINDSNSINNMSDNITMSNIIDPLEFNDRLYRTLNLDTTESFIKTLNVKDIFYNAYDNNYEMNIDNTIDSVDQLQYGINMNYNILSPFTQLNRINDDNKTVSFNAYMFNKSLVDVNNIDFDIDFYKILKYHLDHNLQYIDGTLINEEFYQYIIYNNGEKDLEILLHKDLIGQDLVIPSTYLESQNIILCAYNGNLYILSEEGHNKESYFIDTLYLNEIFVSEDDAEDEYALLFDSLELTYDKVKKAYYKVDMLSNERTYYYIYDKLYSNTDYIYNKYLSNVNLPNLDKYRNLLHLFNIYISDVEENNILYFHNDINVEVNGLVFTHGKYSHDNDSFKIYINGYNKDDITDTRYITIYGLHWIENNGDLLKNIPEEYVNNLLNYGFYVKRDYSLYYKTKEISNIYELPNLKEFDTNEFTYYIDDNRTSIGKFYYKTLNDFKKHNYYNYILNNELGESYKDVEVKYDSENDEFYFYDPIVKDLNNLNKSYKNLLYYSISFYKNDQLVNNVTINTINNEEYDYICIEFFYHKTYIVRNRFYLLSDYIDELNSNDNNVLNIIFNDSTIIIETINERISVPSINIKNRYIYYRNELLNDNINVKYPISNQNPSMYWYNMDEDNIESLPSYLNELERYAYNNENESIESIIDKLDEYKRKFEYNKTINTNFLDDSEEARYYYKNYLSKDITGLIGTYRLEIEKSDDDVELNARLCCEIIKDNNIMYYNSIDNNQFTLTGDEQKVTIYIQLDNQTNNNEINCWVIPKLIEIKQIDKQLEYKYEECGDEHIVTKILNKEYYYGNNRSEYIYNLYKDFFNLKYNIYDTYIDENNILNCTLLNSIYEANNAIKLNSYLNYDFYLMHDDKYWYGLYISRETCDKVQKHSDLILPEENKIMTLNGIHTNTTYTLKYEKSSKEYLINRLEFISSNGYNHFKDDDIVAGYIHNNDRLPFNPYISSKWSISPMSLGMSTDSKFESNAEMTILSIPKNDNKYQKGYYKVTVKYSLDRDIQHQFKNTSTIKIS